MTLIRASAIWFAIVLPGFTWAQPAGRPEFDVISIKPSKQFGGGAIAIGRAATPGTVTLTGITPKDLIARAYSLKAYQISGPAWLGDEHFDIEAKASRAVPDAEQRMMLQSLLASRFQMAAHTETKVLPAYELVVGKNGPKIKESAAGGTVSRFYPGKPGISATKIPLQRLAELLSAKIDRPVLDKTGLAGVFDIELTWTPDTAPPDVDLGPSIFTAIQEQLGLRLEVRKAPIEVLAIDRIDRPSEN